MKRVILLTYALLTHPIVFLRYKTSMIGSRINGVCGNVFAASNSVLKKATIKFDGQCNSIRCTGCEIYNSIFILQGTGHSIVLEEGVKLFNVMIKIIWEKNEIRIGKYSTFGGGNLVCGGKQKPS